MHSLHHEKPSSYDKSLPAPTNFLCASSCLSFACSSNALNSACNLLSNSSSGFGSSVFLGSSTTVGNLGCIGGGLCGIAGTTNVFGGVGSLPFTSCGGSPNGGGGAFFFGGNPIDGGGFAIPSGRMKSAGGGGLSVEGKLLAVVALLFLPALLPLLFVH